MGYSVPLEIVFGEVRRHELKWRQTYDEPNDWAWSEITAKARKKLADAKEGDLIEVVFNYDDSIYPVVEARRITGSPEEAVKLLSARVEALETILDELPDLMRRSADSVSGDRYEDSKRVIHAVAMKIQMENEKRKAVR